MFEGVTRGIENEASVLGQVITHAPAAIWDDIAGDWKNHRGALLEKGAISAAAGLGLGVLLSRSNFLVGGVLTGLAVAQGVDAGRSAFSLMGKAWGADSAARRDLLARQAIAGIGRCGADALETSTGFLAGGGAGIMLSRQFGATDALALAVRDRINDPARYRFEQSGSAVGHSLKNVLPDSLRDRAAFIGPGTERLPAALVAADGKVDVLNLSRILADKHPWTESERLVGTPDGQVARVMSGTEEWRSVRLSDLKASRTARGGPAGVELPAIDRPGRISFHTHPPEGMGESYLVSGARPSVNDLKATMDVGLIQSGPVTTVYEGAARSFMDSVSRGKPFEPTLRAVFFDRTRQLAASLETAWRADRGSFESAVIRPLDYQATAKVLSAWDKQWSSLSDIPTDSSFFSKPGALEFVKLGVYK